MVPSLLIRGMLVGLLAGLLVFTFAKVFGEPPVDRAIAFEAALDEARAKVEQAGGMPAMDEPELVSRPVQAGWGLATGVVVYAAAFGGLFALVFAATNRRAADIGPRATAALLAAAGFVSVYLVPNLKYPANPPSVGAPETIGYRTALYVAMLALSVAAMVLACVVRKRLLVRHGGWAAALAALGLYVGTMLVVGSVMPAINEVPEAFPATVLWQFRIASLGMQVVLWSTLGLVFGAVVERAWRPHPGGGDRREWAAAP